MLYFDNHPQGHYGTIRQQIWCILHFPLQLAIVGVVEGSQQVTLAWYVIKSFTKVIKDVDHYCGQLGYQGTELTDKLWNTIDYFQLYKKAESAGQLDVITQDLWVIGNDTSLCATGNLDKDMANWPKSISKMLHDVLGGIYESLGMDVPEDGDPAVVALHSWKIVYIYYWASILTLLICLMVCLHLIRKGARVDIFDWFSMTARGLGVAASIAFLIVAAKSGAFYNLISSPAILPMVVGMFFAIITLDHIGRKLSNWRLRPGDVVFNEHDTDGEHGHGNQHQEHGDSKTAAHDTMHEQPPNRDSMRHHQSASSQNAFSPHYVPTGAPY